VRGSAGRASEKHVVIMGAGPAGLTAAYELSRHGIRSTVLEADPRFVGGLARTVEANGYRFDIGGHRFFSKSQEIEDLWTEILGDEMLSRERLSRIYYRNRYFDYPLKATNALLNMGVLETLRCGLSYAWARIHPVKNPVSLEDWVRNQFGYRLFSIFFKTYTEKVWGMSTKELSADWAAQRIKGLSLMAAVRSAILPERFRKGGREAVIKTLIDRFRYPRLGPGQMWELVTARLRAAGNTVELGSRVVAIHHRDGRVRSVTVVTASGTTREVVGTDFISTIPVRDLIGMLAPAAPDPVSQAAAQLRYRDFLSVAVVVNRETVFPDNWIYIHDPSVKVGRIQNFKNWSPAMVADPKKTGLGLEYFCFEGDGLWTMSDAELVDLARRELASLRICRPDEVLSGTVMRMPKAYPVYDDVYKQHLKVIRDHLDFALPNLDLVGRNGMHHYNNQDHSMMTGMLVARNIALGANYDPWLVNTDAEYHEEERAGEAAGGDGQAGRQVPQRIAS
jgi:protoporphyrinogen oxidase